MSFTIKDNLVFGGSQDELSWIKRTLVDGGMCIPKYHSSYMGKRYEAKLREGAEVDDGSVAAG